MTSGPRTLAEILAKGPQVFQGYWHNDAANAETFDEDHWFKTGDIGALDDEGFLRITGRKKELIVTAAGKNVAPAPLEDRLRAHPLISQAVVVGDNRPFIAALITIDEDAFAEWATLRDRPGATVADLAGDEILCTVIQAAVDDANLSVARVESIRKFVILPQDLTVASGEYQHRGLGTLLLLMLVDEASRNRITSFVNFVMWENEELLDELRAAGGRVEPDEPGVARVEIDFPPPEEPSRLDIGRAILRRLAQATRLSPLGIRPARDR